MTKQTKLSEAISIINSRETAPDEATIKKAITILIKDYTPSEVFAMRFGRQPSQQEVEFLNNIQ